jgi:AcrR family transcriptional regulator
MAQAIVNEPADRRKAHPRSDRRIIRTKRALRRALIELIEERGYDGFTVNDLCKRADINRGTFYNHYRDKDDLLNSLETEFFEKLGDYQERMGDLSLVTLGKYMLTKQPLPLLVDLFTYLREQGGFLHAVIGKGGDASFSGRLCDAVCTNFIQCILHERYRNSDDPFVGYYVAFFSNAYLGVITRWIETGMQESPEKMARIATRLLFIKPGESIEL